MNRVSRSAIAALGLVIMLTAASSWGQAPPNNDVSDKATLPAAPARSEVTPLVPTKQRLGDSALQSNTTGVNNTATGSQSLLD